MPFLKKIFRGVPLIPFLCLLLFYTWQTWVAKGNGFFWDTVQFGSLHSHWYFDNSFRYFFLPDELDSGHAPAFGMYIAACWLLFGKSLAISHFAMLPWLIIAIWQMFLLANRLTTDRLLQIAVVLLLMTDPVWSAQSTLVSPDVVLGACLLGAINAILTDKRWLLSLFIIGLSLVSNRGLMISVVLFLAAYFYHNDIQISWKQMVKTVLNFLPGWFLAGTYLIVHYLGKGWIGYYEGSSWNESFERVNSIELIRNVAVFGWRLIDFGHLFIWLILFFLLIKNGRHIRFLQDRTTRFIGMLGIGLIAFFALTVLPYKGLMGHRYFLPIYWVVSIFLFLSILQLTEKAARKWLSVAIIALLTGNCWVYPQPIATGWDSTLAHLSYYALRAKMISYMEDNNIPFEQTGTAFPNQLSTKFIDLSTENHSFEKKDLQLNQYIFYSNIMNDFTPSELQTLQQDWKIISSFKQSFVEVTLYKKL
jgi:hypothetical protein